MVPQHPDLDAVAFLLGTWRGEGIGEYPGVEPFGFTEELTFEHVGDAFLLVTESAWTPDGEPLHFERGTLRTLGDGRVDLTLAHPIGVAEVSEGTIDGTSIALCSTAVVRTSTGSPVTEIERRYDIADGRLTYDVAMATEGVDKTFHVRAALTRE
ncbi:MAG TPA: FABP family protein [Actinomycetota bacterium]|nr:FABP family protein [Actinomycetota bacterium]